MNVKLKIPLPPEGMTARRLLMNFLGQLAGEADVSIWNNNAVLSAPSRKDLVVAINGCMKDAGEGLKISLTREPGRLLDFPIHINDQKWIFAKRFGKVERGFCKVISEILIDSDISWSELSRDLQSIDASLKHVRLGVKDLMAMPQPFLYERYQASYEFLRGRGGEKIEFKASRAWMYLLFAGFAVGYCGNFDNELVIAFIPESTLARMFKDEGFWNMMAGGEGLLPTFRELNLPPRPATAYMLYFACTFAEKMWTKWHIIDEVLKRERPIIELDRVARSPQAFTLVERISLDLGSLLHGISKLSEESIGWIRRKARKTLVGFRGAPQHFGDYAMLTAMIFQVLTGSRDPTDLCYYALRVVAEHEAEQLKTQEEKVRGFIAEGRRIRRLLRELVFEA